MTRVPSTATTFTDQLILEGGLQTGLIVGVGIGATLMIGAVAISLVLMKKRQKTPQHSEDQSSPSDAQSVGDTSQITVDEALSSGHYSFTYEGAASAINTFGTISVPGDDPTVINVPLI
jgi:hypothetical protein